MNTEVKRSIIEAPSNELLYQIEVYNGLIPAYIVKKHDGSIPYIHNKSTAAAHASERINITRQRNSTQLTQVACPEPRLNTLMTDLVPVQKNARIPVQCD